MKGINYVYVNSTHKILYRGKLLREKTLPGFVWSVQEASICACS